jgi:hypothetical protein
MLKAIMLRSKTNASRAWMIDRTRDDPGHLSGAYDDVCSLAEPFPSQLMEVR